MNREDTHLEELTALSLEWRMKIVDLESRLDDMDGPEQLTTIGLVDHLKQQQAIVDQYLQLMHRHEDTSLGRNVAEVRHLLKDIDATYRRALVYFD